MTAQAHRDIAIDIVRTIAIIIMIGANLASLLSNHHPLLFRYYCSLAAPLFVALAGMMVARAVIKNKHIKFVYFLKRGIFLMLCGAFLDAVISATVPFITVDVLYTIGLLLPLTYLAAKTTVKMEFILIALVIVCTLIGQKWLGYNKEPLSIDFNDIPALSSALLVRIGKMWLIDGWFPIFPWLSFLIFGVTLGKMRWSKNTNHHFAQAKYITIGSFLLMAGVGLMHYFPSPHYIRDGYIELFYPPTVGFIILSFGAIILIMSMADKSVNYRFWRLLLPLGQTSLFIYMAHIIIIQILLYYLVTITENQYFFIYGAMTLSLLLCTTFLCIIKEKHHPLPLPIKWLFGA